MNNPATREIAADDMTASEFVHHACVVMHSVLSKFDPGTPDYQATLDLIEAFKEMLPIVLAQHKLRLQST